MAKLKKGLLAAGVLGLSLVGVGCRNQGYEDRGAAPERSTAPATREDVQTPPEDRSIGGSGVPTGSEMQTGSESIGTTGTTGTTGTAEQPGSMEPGTGGSQQQETMGQTGTWTEEPGIGGAGKGKGKTDAGTAGGADAGM